MKITDVQIDSFGHWKGLQLPELSSQVTVIYGPNEAGKSTLLHLMRAILYGFTVNQHARFIPPRYPGSIGGQLSVRSPNGRFRIQRHLHSSGPLRHNQEGNLVIQSGDGSSRGKHALTTLLHGIDDAIFRNVFAVGLSEMQQLGTLSDTQAAQQLYGLAAGADRVSISDVAEQLEAARQRRLKRRDPLSLISLLDRLHPPTSSDDGEPVQTQRWLRLMEELRQLQQQIAELEQSQKRFSPLIAQAATRAALREKWKKARRLHQRLADMGPQPKIPAEVLQRLRQMTEQIRQHRKQWEKTRGRRRQLRDQASKLAGSPALLHHAEPIQSLHQRSARVTGLVQETEQLKVKIEETEFELQAELERIGIKTTWRMDAMPLITNELMESLREPARLCREARERTEAIEHEEQTHRTALEQIQTRLSSALKGTKFTDLSTALKRGEQNVRLLRSRIETQGRLDTAQRQLAEVHEENFEWTKRQLIPWRGLMGLGVIFALGGLLLLIACFGDSFGLGDDQRGTLAILGGLLGALSLGAKGLYEFAAGRSAAGCRDELTQLKKQMARHREELQKIDKQLGPSSDTWHERLQEAEDEWEQLSELQPMEAQRAAAQERLDRTIADKTQIAQQLKDARQLWRDALRTGGLPESITPTQFRQMSQPDSLVGQLRQKLVGYHEQNRQKQGELQELQQKVQGLLDRANLHEKSDRLEDQIAQLAQALQQARETHQQREALHRQWREGAREQERIAREAKRIRQRRQELVARYGVANAQELKAVTKRRQESVRLTKQRDLMLAEIAEQLGACCPLAQLRKDLAKGKFESRLKTWEREHDLAAQSLAGLLERRGELNQQLKLIVGQRDHLARKLEASELEAQFTRQGRQWVSLAGISLSLDSVRKSYESDRQPETLSEASSYLTQLTQGKYSRIWTPFGESILCVDDQQGRAVRVEHLSRGTREQVFLSLRLALAAEYSRRGADLPLILDDVFVNFDAQRALAAAQTVCRFAEAGHQVLVFTCHEHIRDVFRKLGVDLRRLPDAQQNAEHPQPVLPWTEPLPVVAEQPVLEPEPDVYEPPVEEIEEHEPVYEPESVAVVEEPEEFDPELEHELLYGAPQYDPGYEPVVRKVRRPLRRRRPQRPVPPPPPIEELIDEPLWYPVEYEASR